MPSISVKAAFGEITFYLEGPYTVVYSRGGYTTYKYSDGTSSYSHFGLETLSDVLLCGMDSREINETYENGNISIKGIHYTAITKSMIVNNDGWYTTSIDPILKEKTIGYLTTNYEFPNKCNKFSIRDEGDAVYATQVTSHDYRLSESPTIQHGSKYTCSRCGDYYYDDDRLDVVLSFNATTTGGNTTETNVKCKGESVIPLTGKTAHKDGWEFVGWNTNKAATTALSSVTMDDNKTVYAIFKKDITVDFIDG